MATTASTIVAQVGDIGTAFQITLTDENGNIIDVSSATVKQVIFQRPDGTDLVGTASFGTNGTDGVIQYITQANDLNIAGRWQIQGFVQLSNGSWHTQTGVFKVKDNL